MRSPNAVLARAYMQGHGGLNDDEMAAAKKAVDPEGKMTDGQRNMTALGSVWQYWQNKGDPEKAGRVAFQMLQHYRNAAQRYAAIAAHANEKGDLPLAAQATMRAYQNVPDGKDMSIEVNPDGGYFYHLTGPKGEDIANGIATPQQLGSAATGLASGGFDQALLTAAGQAEKAKEAKAPAPPKASDRLNMEKLVGGHVDKFVSDWNDKSAKEGKTPEEKAAAPTEYVAELHGATQGLMQHNPDMNGAQAVRAAHMLLQPGSKDPEKMDFKITKGKEGEDPTVDFGGKFKAKVPQALLSNFENSRAARIKAETDKIEKKITDEEQPSGVAEGAKQVGRGALGLAKEGGEALGTMGRIAGGAVRGAIPDELYERSKAILGRTAGDVERGTRNPGAIPIDPEDRPL